MNMKKRGLIWLAGACAVAVAAAAAGVFIFPQRVQSPPVSSSVAAATPPATKAAEQQTAATPVQQKKVVEAPVDPTTLEAAFDIVRVEKSGEAVIAGRAAPGSMVAVKWNGAVVGTTKASADGSFAIVPDKPLAAGTGALTLEATKDGKTFQAPGSVVVSVEAAAPVVVAKLDPAKPTQVTQAGETSLPATSVTLGAVDYDSQGNIVFSGKAPAGSTLRFYVDNALAGEAVTDGNGTWSFKGTGAVTVGTHILRADALDTKGAVVSRAETPFMREDVAKLAVPAGPASQPVVPASPGVAPGPVTPSAVPPGQAEAASPVVEVRRIVIQPGNNLWRVSRQVYGKGVMYTLIFEANREQIKNPNRIYPGQILTAPDKKG